MAVWANLALCRIKKGAVGKALLVLVVVGLVAGLDELNQLRSSLRTGAIEDVVLDLCGGFAGLVTSWLFFKSKDRHGKDKATAGLLSLSSI